MKKIVLLLLAVSAMIITSCSKNKDSGNYPELLSLSVWESSTLSNEAGKQTKLQINFINASQWKLTSIFVNDTYIDRIEFDEKGNYSYYKGKGEISGNFLFYSASIVLKDGQRINVKDSNLFYQQGFNVFQTIYFDKDSFKVDDNVMTFIGQTFYRK